MTSRAEQKLEAVIDLHRKYPMYPVARYAHEPGDECRSCRGSIEDDARHGESDNGDEVLCFVRGPSYFVCEECTRRGADEVLHPCTTWSIAKGEK